MKLKCRLRLLALSLLGTSFLISACTIANYTPAIPDNQPPTILTEKSGAISFSYLPELWHDGKNNPNNQRSLPKAVLKVREIFEKNTQFERVIISATPPVKGMHVNIYLEHHVSFSPYEIASIATLGILPHYADGLAYTVHFDVLADNTPVKHYEEEIRGKGVSWIGFLPFWWITHILNTSEDEAFLGTVYNFTRAARRDGWLTPKTCSSPGRLSPDQGARAMKSTD